VPVSNSLDQARNSSEAPFSIKAPRERTSVLHARFRAGVGPSRMHQKSHILVENVKGYQNTPTSHACMQS
jgi:hypothetical protein